MRVQEYLYLHSERSQLIIENERFARVQVMKPRSRAALHVATFTFYFMLIGRYLEHGKLANYYYVLPVIRPFIVICDSSKVHVHY